MDFKKEFKRLLQIVKNNRKDNSIPFRNEDIANVLGYNRTYFSALIGKKGVVTKDHIKQLKLHFPFLSENQTPREIDELDGITLNEDSPVYKKTGTDNRYLKLLEDNDRFFKDLVKTNLGRADYVQHAILAHLKGIIQRDAQQESGGDPKMEKELMTQMGKRIAAYMALPVGKDTVPGNQSNP